MRRPKPGTESGAGEPRKIRQFEIISPRRLACDNDNTNEGAVHINFDTIVGRARVTQRLGLLALGIRLLMQCFTILLRVT